MDEVRQGYRVSTYGDSWTQFWVMPPTFLEDEDIINSLPVAPEGGSGPGQRFAHYPCIRRTATRVLVTQFGGYDV